MSGRVRVPKLSDLDSGNWFRAFLEVFKSMWALGRKWEDALG